MELGAVRDLDHQDCYRIVQSGDSRFDGWFVTAVKSTKIYCRPSCPALTPKVVNVDFFRHAAAAQAEGYRPCKRCLPNASPGSPEWDVRGDAVGRAMRLIVDGVVQRDGVSGLASQMGYSERQLNRILVSELGASAKAIALTQCAQSARVLLENTQLPVTEVAFAAGFGSVRQFNDTIRKVFEQTPTQLRSSRRVADAKRQARESGSLSSKLTPISVNIQMRTPFAHAEMLEFLDKRSIPGVETVVGDAYFRTLQLPEGRAVTRLRFREDHCEAQFWLESLSDLQPAIFRMRRLIDADSDPRSVDDHLASTGLLQPSVQATPGLRAPGICGGLEATIRAVVGQQISVVAAIKVLGRIVETAGTPWDHGVVEVAELLTHCFPTAEQIASISPEELPMTRARGATVVRVGEAIATEEIDLGLGADWSETREQLLAIKGIGPWTADYVMMRGVGSPNVVLSGDVGVYNGLEFLGEPRDSLEEWGKRWSPWNSYAMGHLWRANAAWQAQKARKKGTK